MLSLARGVYFSERIPAAVAACKPTSLSSTTTHRAGENPMILAAWRNKPGSGFHDSISYELKIFFPKNDNSPLTRKACLILDVGPLDATQKGNEMARSIEQTPGFGSSCKSNNSETRVRYRCSKSKSRGAPRRLSISASISANFLPRYRSTSDSTVSWSCGSRSRKLDCKVVRYLQAYRLSQKLHRLSASVAVTGGSFR